MKAKISEKGFKLIELSRTEVRQVFLTQGICDSCNSMDKNTGNYIAVLNQWFCSECYENWHSKGVYYPEDVKIEGRNFQYVLNKCKSILK